MRTLGVDPGRGPARAARAVTQLLCGALALGLVWSAFAELEIAASGVGRIVPSRQVQLVQNLEGGILASMLVQEGATVREGQTVARIQDAEFKANYGEAQANRVGLQLAIARLQAEANNASYLDIPIALEQEAPDLAAREEELFRQRKAQVQGNVHALRQTVAGAENEGRRAQESLPLLRQSLALATEQRGILEPQVAQGLISKVELLAIDQRLLELRGKINEAQRAVSSARAAAQEAREKLNAEQARARAEASAQLTEAKVKLAALGQSMTASRDRMSRRDVKAPFSGVVKTLFVRSAGAVLRPGEPLMELVPTEDELIVEARFSPTDIAFLHPGLPAAIRITAYDASIYGALPAEVTQVAADATVPEQGEPYYTVRARASQSFVGPDGKALALRPGMVATLDVVTGHRTLLAYLIKPVAKMAQTSLRER